MIKNIAIRKSKIEEVAVAVPLIYSSGPPTFEYVFKNNLVNAQDFLTYAFVREGGEFSFQNHYSSYLDDQMVGIGSVFSAKEANAFTLSDALNILRFYGWKSFERIKSGLQVENMIKLPRKNEIALAHLGITPDFRGKGLGTKLIHLLKAEAKKTPASIFVLDVSEENPRAKALYERLGFQTTKNYPSNLKNKYSYVANHFRMELVGMEYMRE